MFQVIIYIYTYIYICIETHPYPTSSPLKDVKLQLPLTFISINFEYTPKNPANRVGMNQKKYTLLRFPGQVTPSNFKIKQNFTPLEDASHDLDYYILSEGSLTHDGCMGLVYLPT